jgi:copper(I)-binding protein
MTRILPTLRAVTLGLSALGVATAAQAEVTVTDPWIAEAPPTAMALAAFMRLENDAETPRRLTAAEAPGFERIELHRSIEEDGGHRMRRQEMIEIPADGATSLAPGGYHIMLIGVAEPLVEGDTVPLTLVFADGERRTLEVPVRRRAFMR